MTRRTGDADEMAAKQFMSMELAVARAADVESRIAWPACCLIAGVWSGDAMFAISRRTNMNRFVVGLALALRALRHHGISSPLRRRRGAARPARPRADRAPGCARAHRRRNATAGDRVVRRRVCGPPAHLGRRDRDSSARRQCLRCRRRRGARRRSGRTGSRSASAARRSCWSILSRRSASPQWSDRAGRQRAPRSNGTVTRQDPGRRGTRPFGGARFAARRAHRARAVGHDELRAGVGTRHRLRGAGLPDAAADGGDHRAQPRVLQEVAGQSALLAEARRLDVHCRARRSSCRRSRTR